MPNFHHGALIEYGPDLIGPVPNIVVFQFNPESLKRTMNVPSRPTGANYRESSQAGEKTFEQISFQAQFSAADELADNKILARRFGVGPRLCALEQMVHPTGTIEGIIGEVVDKVAKALNIGGGGEPSQAIPREQYPRILFIWGATRILPVTIDSMRITELKYDHLLNPVQADVDIDLTVIADDPCSDDALAKGALAYTTLAKEAQAIANLVNTAGQARELIPF